MTQDFRVPLLVGPRAAAGQSLVWDERLDGWAPGPVSGSGTSETIITSATFTVTEAGDYVAARSTTVTLPTGRAWGLAAGEFIVVRRIGGVWYAETGTLPLAPGATPDTTPPNPGTLAATGVTDVALTLTVTGASDDQGLHGDAYAFSTDNGATWTAWQSAASLVVGSLTPATAYTCRHKVRDLAFNEATGAPVTATTKLHPSGHVLASDTFNRADGALGNSDGPGALPWVVASPTLTIAGQKAASAAAFATAVLNVGAADMRVTVQNHSPSTKALVLRSNAGATNQYRLTVSGTTWAIQHAKAAGGNETHTRHTFTRPHPATGDTFGMAVVDNGPNVVFTVYHNGEAIATYTETDPLFIIARTHVHAGLMGWASASLDNFVVAVP